MGGLYERDAMLMMGMVGKQAERNDGQPQSLALSRQGSVITVDQYLQWALDGRLFHAQQGNAASLVDFVEQAYDEDQPQFAVTVPTGRTIVPLSASLNFQDQAGTDNHVIMSQARADIGAGTSTAATITAMRTNPTFESACAAYSLYTANALAATGLIEIARNIDPFVATAAGRLPGFRWDARTSSVIPVLVGPASWIFHVVGSDGPQGFGEYIWAEFETPSLIQKV